MMLIERFIPSCRKLAQLCFLEHVYDIQQVYLSLLSSNVKINI